VESYIKSLPSHRLAQHSSNDLDHYLKDLGRNKRLTDRTFRQAIEPLQILFVDIVSPPWAESFPWEFWINSASQLSHSHASLARYYSQAKMSKHNTANYKNRQPYTRFSEQNDKMTAPELLIHSVPQQW
ncbi:MAG: hypothetical protein ACC707_17270, partial [Thiohalomonadales bacterium]